MQNIQNPKLSRKVQGKANILVVPLEFSLQAVSENGFLEIFSDFMHISAFLCLLSCCKFIDVSDTDDTQLVVC